MDAALAARKQMPQACGENPKTLKKIIFMASKARHRIDQAKFINS